MAALADNPFAAPTIVVAPAVLTNAASVLCLGTGNRIARVVDRTRVLNAGTVGVGGLVVGCTMMVRETGLAVEFLSEELDLAGQPAHESVPPI